MVRLQNGERSVIACTNKIIIKTMYATFFDRHGPILEVPVPKGSSVTGQLYRAGSWKGRQSIHRAPPARTGTRGLHLLHDNSLAHISAAVAKYLHEIKSLSIPIQLRPRPLWLLVVSKIKRIACMSSLWIQNQDWL